MDVGTMCAAVLHGPRDLRVEGRSRQAPGTGEVLVEVSHCGVCGTDLHMVIDGWGRPGSVGGHEWSGRVVATGPGVDDLDIGDAVVGGSTPTCGTCRTCRDGRPSLCEQRNVAGTSGSDGAFAHFVRVDRRSVVPVPPGLDLRTAALAEPLAVALHALSRGDVRPHHRVLVTGVGPIGALALVALRARGVTDVVVSEPRAARRRLAERLGATACEPGDLQRFTIVEPQRMVDHPVDVALECSGAASAAEEALCQLRRGGTLVLVGTGLEPPKLDPNRILLNELVVTGAFEYDAGGIEEALAALADGSADASAVLEEDDVPLEGLLTAMEDLAAGRIAGKVLVAPALTPIPPPEEGP